MKAHCTRCNLPVELADPPRPQIYNTPGVSLLMIEHPKQGFCLHCRTVVSVGLVGAQLTLAAMPVAPAKQDPVIVVPNGATPPTRKG
jgi:hypothetical protein